MREYASLTSLVKHFDLSLHPITISNALLKAGILREVSYLSTTGSGKEKSFKEIVPEGLIFGVNRWTAHDFKTEPRFFVDSFHDLVTLVIDQLIKEAGGMR